MTLLEVDQLSFTWPAGGAVLQDVTFGVGPSECLHLTGDSGSGKSTLLGLVAGSHRPARGAVTLDGHPANSPDARTLRWYMTSAPAIYPLLTVREQLHFYAAAHHVDQTASLTLLHHVLQAHVEDLLCRDLTSEQAQIVWFTAALSCHGAGLLVLDEPFTAVGVQPARRMVAALQQHLDGGGTVLLSSRTHGDLLHPSENWRTLAPPWNESPSLTP
ncbi:MULTISPECIES: ABC transporter ATP-binding protein [Kocuria]|uniref:ATP-binding cassette domain-containing protein n=1 Tax=Kocuria subflava TaxID=1736139 RepID=A0A846TUR4_9MICC|nr:ATP-binding cassette domain-containing protein [Kocuria sp. CPCC 104605]NKE10589.1 ATP-binding cassette domain-containing protein [Kocuria subflava]